MLEHASRRMGHFIMDCFEMGQYVLCTFIRPLSMLRIRIWRICISEACTAQWAIISQLTCSWGSDSPDGDAGNTGGVSAGRPQPAVTVGSASNNQPGLPTTVHPQVHAFPAKLHIFFGGKKLHIFGNWMCYSISLHETSGNMW